MIRLIRMHKYLPLCALLLLLHGCNRPAVVPPTGEAAPEEEFAGIPAAGTTAEMNETTLILYDTRPGAGAARKPMVVIHAGNLKASMEGGNQLSFEDARAVMRGIQEVDEMVFEAREGSFIEGERAHLGGGVTARAGEMSIHLEDIHITMPKDDAPAMASTDLPVVMDSPLLKLSAQSLRLYPETREFELIDGSGSVQLGELHP